MIENIAVSMELPPFWKHDPEMWFAQIESQFFNYRITLDESKFHTIVGQIETEILEAVSDFVKSPPTEHKYDELKKRLVQHFSKSTQQKTEKMLTKTEMNDKKPSFVLQEIKNSRIRHKISVDETIAGPHSTDFGSGRRRLVQTRRISGQSFRF